ncbi:DUF2304 domain-containing protein [Litorilituus lipolyticus]|uniref:DUF2304 domain-containing protein n=1 Tax=Litorilituus lipolyticus TaxID=2491017 RepID=A0A502KZK9_9GAMM|nr:DUF2304 domain-containing protein [Litorilituus lipolyticus]TPH17068.1 DUF2304 domain-containing protein [Litorilituus lipolyticus]
MNNPQIVSSIIGLVLAVVIYWLVRRDHLAPKQALRWVLVATAILVLGTFPVIIDWVGYTVGIAYPPIIPVIVGLGAALIKIMLMDIQQNKSNITQDRIIQKLAILEAELKVLQNIKK